MFWRNLGVNAMAYGMAGHRIANRAMLRNPRLGFAALGGLAGAAIGGIGGLFSSDTSIVGGAAKGFAYGAGAVGLGIGGAALWSRYGARAANYGRRLTKAINPLRGMRTSGL